MAAAKKKRGAQPGNTNASKGKPWQDALRRALLQVEMDGTASPEQIVQHLVTRPRKMKRGEALNQVAEIVVFKALCGDKDSVQEIANRIEGKPAQMIELPEDRGFVLQIIGA